MALDSRTRPRRRPARRRLPVVTALVLLAVAAGLWGWLAAPENTTATVDAPRLHAATAQAEATQADAATERSTTDQNITAPAVAPAAPVAAAAAITAAGREHAAPSGIEPATAGPRAPPHA